MSEHGTEKMPLSSTMAHLYGYIYCMLLSNILTGIPLFGGALYLCGRGVIVFSGILQKKNRKYLPNAGKWWIGIEAVALFALSILLIGLFPTTFESTGLWVLYAAVALCLLADANTRRILKLTGGKDASRRTRIVGIILQGMIIIAMSVILIASLGPWPGWPMSGGFALLVLIRAYALYQMDVRSADERKPSDTTDMRSIQAYQSFEWISLSLIAGIELLTAVMYALLATQTEWLLPAMAVAIGCTLVFAEGAMIFLRRSRNPNRRNPTWLLLIGLAMCTGGAVLCGWMLGRGIVDYVRMYLCLGLCSAGGAMSLTGLYYIEQMMPGVARLMGGTVDTDYTRMRQSNIELARLLGDTLALVALTIFCFAGKADLPRSWDQLCARYQPVMIVMILIVSVGALLSIFHFPFSARYIEKLRKFLHQQEAGEENPALKRQLENAARGQVHQPFLTRFLVSILKIGFKYTLRDEDHIVQDDSNPILFLGNHLEVLGPILCTLWFPVHVRFWSISQMMGDKEKVCDYVYTNTFGKVSWLPDFAARLVSRFIGWLSVNVMSQLECIPVYRDSPMKLRETVRISIEALEAGDNLMIFPESPDQKYELQGIGKLSPGFVMLATAYWKKAGKRLRMLPVYISKAEKTIQFGTIFVFNPDNPYADEQKRIIDETERQVFAMAGIEPDTEEAANA